MKMIMTGAALSALVFTSVIATPARANDPLAVAAAVKVIIGVGSLLTPAANSTGTSVNTDYALTGKGMPVPSARQAPGTPTPGPMMLRCNAHGTHCAFVPMMTPTD
ncbi:MAG: hypothetical protein AAGF78_08350 [Pseudomonadota bacterium]